jgi:hypothetical protein
LWRVESVLCPKIMSILEAQELLAVYMVAVISIKD